MMDSVTLTIHFKNRVRLFYPKHLPGSQLTSAIQKTFDLSSDEEVELVDRITHDKLSLTTLHSLPPNTHLVSTLVLKHTLQNGGGDMFNHKRNTLLSNEKTVVVHKQNNTFGFQVQYFFAPSQTNLASPYHRMSTIFVKQLDLNGPAAKAGLKQGDRILKVNGISVFNLNLEDVVLMMKKREDYVVLTTVPWYKDYLQVEYPNYAYSEPESDASTASLDRFSPIYSRTTPDPHCISPAVDSNKRLNNSLNRRFSPEQNNITFRNSLPTFVESPITRRSRTLDRNTRCTRSPPVLDTTPVKPPRPNYVLRRQTLNRSPQQQPPADAHNFANNAIEHRNINHKHSQNFNHDPTKRFGNLQYLEDFQLPEKPPSATNSPEMDPLCEALRTQSAISPNFLHKRNSELNMQGNLDCKILDEGSKRHTLRGWTKYFVAVHSSEMSLYKNYNDYVEKRDTPDEGPVDISNCLVQIEYRSKKPVFRLSCQNSKEYLLKAETQDEMHEWIDVIQKLNNMNDNQSLCNMLIKKKADEILKSENGSSDETKCKKNTVRLKEYNGADFQVNTQCDFPSFGSTIEKSIKCQTHKLVPAIVSGCIREVEERGLNTTGIYRLSGNAQAIQTLINEIDRDPRNVDYKAPPWTDISNTCAALKQYFRRLAEPLVPAPLYPDFMEAAQLASSGDKHNRLKVLVNKLPECHYATVKMLFGHLAKVAANCEVNKMHTCNLAIIFGPTVIRSVNNDMVSMVADMSNQCKVVESLISQYSYIFNEELTEETADHSSTDSEMGLFKKKHKPSSNGLTTPSDERASIQTGWEFEYKIDRNRNLSVETSDASVQCNIHDLIKSDEKIYYRKEPVGIVHPYKDDVKMRPVSRIMDKKLVTLDPKIKRNMSESKKDDVVVVDMLDPLPSRRVSSYNPVAPKKSLSLESLLDAINTEHQEKRSANKRGCSQQFDTINMFVRKDNKPAPVSARATVAQQTQSRHQPALSLHHEQPIKPVISTSNPVLVKPINIRRGSIPEDKTVNYTTTHSDRSQPRASQHDSDRSQPRASQHDMVRTNTRKSMQAPPPGDRSEPRWVENMIHNQQGYHPAIITRSQDHLGKSANEAQQRHMKSRRHSDARARWQPGQTHKWVLDNNTTLLESTL